MKSQTIVQQSNETVKFFDELNEEALDSIVGGCFWDDIRDGINRIFGCDGKEIGKGKGKIVRRIPK